MTPDEVRLLNNEYGLVFMRGELPIIDKKYDILRHPNINDTKDGRAPIYEHGKVMYAIEDWQNIMLSDDDYELYSEEDIEELFAEQENEETKE